jgi:hypothetical protein
MGTVLNCGVALGTDGLSEPLVEYSRRSRANSVDNTVDLTLIDADYEGQLSVTGFACAGVAPNKPPISHLVEKPLRDSRLISPLNRRWMTETGSSSMLRLIVTRASSGVKSCFRMRLSTPDPSVENPPASDPDPAAVDDRCRRQTFIFQ